MFSNMSRGLCFRAGDVEGGYQKSYRAKQAAKYVAKIEPIAGVAKHLAAPHSHARPNDSDKLHRFVLLNREGFTSHCQADNITQA